MWEKEERRLALFTIYYRLSISQIVGESDDISPESFLDSQELINLDFEDFSGSAKLITQVEEFLNLNLEAWTQELKTFLENWDQTYLLVKAILFTFLMEKEIFQKKSVVKGDLTKYLRLTQDYVGSQGVSLIHAVLAKIVAKV